MPNSLRGSTLPSDSNLERTWFGALLHHPQAVPSVVSICSDKGLIYNDIYRELWKGVLGLYNEGLAVDPASLMSYVSTKGYMTSEEAKTAVMEVLERRGSAANIESWTQMLYELYRRRRLVSLGIDLAKTGTDMTRPVDDIVSELLERARMTSGLRSVYRSDEAARRLKEELTLRFSSGLTGSSGLMLGVPEFDDALEGVLPDDLVGICGRQGTGKTFLLLQMQRNLLVNYPDGVLPMVSMEMSVDRLCWRHAGSLSGVAPSKIRTGNVTREEYELAMAAYDFIIDRWKHRLRVYEAGSFNGPVTAEAIESATMAEQVAEDVLCVMIDNFGLLFGKTREDKEAQSKHLKQMTARLKVPVFCAFHLNRGQVQQDRRPQMSDLRECLAASSFLTDADTGARVSIRDVVAGQHRVLSMDEKTQKIGAGLVTQTWVKGVRPVFQLRLSSGREIVGTATHPVFTERGWKGLASIRLGEGVAIQAQDSWPFESNPGAESDLKWDEAVSVEPAGDETVYDIRVEGTHTFVANGIVVHNTGQIEQDLDRGLLIDRKDERSKHIRERWDELGIVEGLGWFDWSKNREAKSSAPCHLMFDPRTLEYRTPAEGLVASVDNRDGSSLVHASASSLSVLDELVHGRLSS